MKVITAENNTLVDTSEITGAFKRQAGKVTDAFKGAGSKTKNALKSVHEKLIPAIETVKEYGFGLRVEDANFCVRCGSDIHELGNISFCPHCGKKI